MPSRSSDNQRLLCAFPKLYYFIPPGEPYRMRGSKADIVLTPPGRTVLWLLETLRNETRDISHEALGRVVGRIYRREEFSRTITKLRRAGCIEVPPNEKDSRRKQIQLTAFGRTVIVRLHREHAGHITMLLSRLKASNREQHLRTIEDLADITWDRMQAEPVKTPRKRQFKTAKGRT